MKTLDDLIKEDEAEELAQMEAAAKDWEERHSKELTATFQNTFEAIIQNAENWDKTTFEEWQDIEHVESVYGKFEDDFERELMEIALQALQFGSQDSDSIFEILMATLDLKNYGLIFSR